MEEEEEEVEVMRIKRPNLLSLSLWITHFLLKCHTRWESLWCCAVVLGLAPPSSLCLVNGNMCVAYSIAETQ